MDNQDRIDERSNSKGTISMALMVGLVGLGVLLVKSNAFNAFFYWLHCALAN